jgi:hypothetical protein
MKTYITILLSFLLGSLITLLVTYFGYIQYCKSNWEKQGYNTGYIKAHYDIYQKVKNELGELSSNSKSKDFFSVKDIDVVMVNIDGIQTLRAIKY